MSGRLAVSDSLVEQPASRLTALAVDAALAVGCYIAAFALRFDAAEFAQFFPSALRTLPVVVVSQVVALSAFRAHTYRQGRRWFPRLLAGILVGTGSGVLLAWLVYGFQGVSRVSFAVDAMLLAFAAFGWRAAFSLMRLARAAREVQASPHEMEDRTGPPSISAGLLGLVRYRELLRNLVLRDVKLKYRGSVFGFFWSLANPILMVVTYTIAFRYIMQVRTEGFVFNLLLGLLNWTFFSSSAMMSTGSVVGAGALVKSVAFPRVILPVATVLFNLVQFLLAIAVFLPLALVIFGIAPSPAILLFPLLLALQILFTAGVAFALATLTSFFRDIRHILEIALGILFWTTPILYRYDSLPESLQMPILLSPMSSFVIAYQQIFYQGRVPNLAIWLAAGSYAVGMFVLGASLFVNTEDRLAEQV
jgi:ABC-type polysaccharide/polyol phosphate export permease